MSVTRSLVVFHGVTFEPAIDGARLTKQIGQVFDLMKDGRWRMLAEISAATGPPTPSVSTRLRDLRRRRFGGFEVEKRRLTAVAGTWEYRLALGESDQ